MDKRQRRRRAVNAWRLPMHTARDGDRSGNRAGFRLHPEGEEIRAGIERLSLPRSTQTSHEDVPAIAGSLDRQRNAFEGKHLGEPIEVRVLVQNSQAALLSHHCRDQRVRDGHTVVAVAASGKLSERCHRGV